VDAIEAGGIGQPLRAVAIHHIGLPWVRPHQAGWSAKDAAARNWIGDDRFSGGVFLDHLVHAVDRCSWALGEPTPLMATAIPTTIALPQPLDRRMAMAARIAFAGGATLEIDVIRREGIEDRVEETLHGRRGNADLRRCTIPGQAFAAAAGDAGGHATCMASFIESLKGGPHRDDLRISLAGRDARTYASQGQQRAAVLAFKISEIRLLEEQLGFAPILALDDVSSELDPQRNARLFAFLSHFQGQVFITTTDRSFIRIDTPFRLWRMTRGQLTTESA
jgi:predicted dehydrogenase